MLGAYRLYTDVIIRTPPIPPSCPTDSNSEKVETVTLRRKHEDKCWSSGITRRQGYSNKL